MAVWNANEMPERDRFPYWREVLCEAYIALNPILEGEQRFKGEVRANLLDCINVTTISSSRQKIHRRRLDISRMPHEVYFLNLQVKGQCRMMQGSREALLEPGDFSLVDSTEPYLNDYCSDDWTQYSFRIPRAMLKPLLKQADKQTAIRFTNAHPIASVAIDYLKSVAQNAEHIGTASTPIANHIVDLVAMAAGVSTTEEDRARGTLRSQLSRSVIQFIGAHAADPTLTPAKAAQHFKISVRYVHRLLEESGETFSRLLLKRRLERCADDLRAEAAISISEIAFRWGFNDLSHFSKTFRHHFGVAPRDYRGQ
ncbi:helix-turn-helix domain-containing protein [Agrobacterium vitis]|uniref:helix-turn-helix domain-containing protein n=1 Tax=Agrobacterium vitis TaxID=373 RepID=UPI0012E945E1|nr:helix-turn-helix domain-containing protein [Agrobacterium vitis]MUZ62177.1 helix-turn-helix domain-containing protein [Agrobacterium vitis]MVA18905.1 helix-turn-helix domain-containing protein [Agrobacterium vitis]